MSKKVISLFLIFSMIFCMMSTSMLVYAENSSEFVITADKTEVYYGDTITYTVSIGPIKNFQSANFTLIIPNGLIFVNGTVFDGLKEIIGATEVGFENSTLTFYLGGLGAYTSNEETILMTFTCMVNENAINDCEIKIMDDYDFADNTWTSYQMIISTSNSKITIITTTPSPTATSTPTPTTTNTPTPTATNTPKPTATSTPTPTATSTPKPTATSTPKPTATSTPQPTATSTPIPTATSTPTPTATSTPTPTATSTPKPTATNTPKPTATSTPTPTATSTPKPTTTNTPTPTATSTPKPTATSTPKPTATSTPIPTATSTPKPTATSTPKPTATSTPKPTATSTPKPTATSTPKPTATSTPKPTATSTPSLMATSTPKPTATSTPKPTATSTPKPTATSTPKPIATSTPTPTATSMPSPMTTSTPKPTATSTPSSTTTSTPKPTATSTPKPTATSTPSPTTTSTPKPTATSTPQPIATSTPTPTAEPEKFPYIQGEEEKFGWDAIGKVIEDSKEETVVMVDMNGLTIVPKDIFKKMIEKDIFVEFKLNSGLMWIVNSKTVNAEDIEKIGDIDFAVTIESEEKPLNNIPVEVINTVAKEYDSIEISLAHSGQFGFEAVLTADLDEKNAGLYANLFFYDKDIKEMVFICTDEIAKDGKAEFIFTHASDYLIVLSEASMSSEQEEKPEEITPPADDTISKEEQVTEIIYTVVKGDTLSKIARQYDCTVKEIVAMNSNIIKNPNLIQIGWKLKILVKGIENAPEQEKTEIPMAPVEDKKYIIYVVKKGDSLWKIAKQHGCKIEDIVRWNSPLIKNPSLIYSGWELKIWK